MDINNLTDEERDEAVRAVDLVNTAWSLRARIADDRGVRIGWSAGAQAYDALRRMGPDMHGLGNPVQIEGMGGKLLLCGYEVRPDALLDSWGIVLSIAPGEPS